MFVVAKTITGFKLETEGGNRKGGGIKKTNQAPFNCLPIQFRVIGS